jgi:hypothetical protein
LCKNAQAILEESDHDQETANSGQIPGVNDTLSAELSEFPRRLVGTPAIR